MVPSICYSVSFVGLCTNPHPVAPLPWAPLTLLFLLLSAADCIKFLVGKENVLGTNAWSVCKGFKGFGGWSREKIWPREAETHDKLYWMGTTELTEEGKTLTAWDHPEAYSLGITLRRGEGGRQECGKGAYMSKWCRSRAQWEVSESDSSRGP